MHRVRQRLILPMAPTIYCLRHGQGFHNVGRGAYDLHDPQLTPLGESQCKHLRDYAFPEQSSISAILSSPMCRALHTATAVFAPALQSRMQAKSIIAIPDAQETSDDACDIGSDPVLLRTTVLQNNWPVDLSLVTSGWNVKTTGTRYSPQSDAISRRARDARSFIRKLARELVVSGNKDPQIVLVSHGGFLHYFTDDWEEAYNFPGTGWHNCEMTSYTFENDIMVDDGDDNARLVETIQSRQKRGKILPMAKDEDQKRMYRKAMEEWEKQGLQRPDEVGQNEEGDLAGVENH